MDDDNKAGATQLSAESTTSSAYTWCMDGNVNFAHQSAAGEATSKEVVLTQKIVDFLPAIVYEKMLELSSKSAGRFPMGKPIENETVFSTESIDGKLLWSSTEKTQTDFLVGLKDKPTLKLVSSMLISWGYLLCKGLDPTYFTLLKCTNQLGVHQFARALVAEARQGKNPEWTFGTVPSGVVKTFEVFTVRGREKIQTSFKTAFGKGGIDLAKLMIFSLQELAKNLSGSMIKIGLEQEVQSAQSIAAFCIGVTEHKDQVKEEVFERMVANGDVVRFDKKPNGEAKIISGKVKIVKHVPKKLVIANQDSRLKEGEKAAVSAWAEVHRYTLSSEEVKVVSESIVTLEAKIKFANNLASVCQKIRKQEITVEVVLDKRREQIMADPRFKNAESEKKTATFKELSTELIDSLSGDVVALLATPVYATRADFLAAIQSQET